MTNASSFFRPFAPLALAGMLSAAFLPVAGAAPIKPEDAAKLEKDVTQGALRIVEDGGRIVECPLKHTDVKAEVSGFIARVKVTQTFQNPTKEKIEAVYVFPLPNEAAVDDMTMVIGTRKIVGEIKKRADARAIYEQALSSGQTAALLEQERPNIFTQSVGNIEAGQEVKIEISYVDVLKYDVGTYEFHFPMVVGPRYNPGTPSGGPPAPRAPELEGKVSKPEANTDQVPDASKINPPVLKPEFRTGADISLSLTLDAGVPIQSLSTVNHRSEIKQEGDRKARIWIAPTDKLPNKDFVLRYGVVGKKPEMALLSHTGSYSGDAKRAGEGYFMLMVQPKEDERLTKSPPREIVFLIDVSGSMSGQPIGKCQQIMRHMLKLCREGKDTVQVVTFASQANKLFEKALPVTEANIGRAVNFNENLKGGGGTEMLKGVQMAIDDPIDKERMRIVVMLTDGYIGNEAQIIEHVGKNCGDQVRFWAVGIGQAPNMFLIDGVAKQGGGMGKRLGLEDDSVGLAQEIMTRIQRAQLAKVKIDWGTLAVSETFPAKIPELWAGRPIVIHGRYKGGGEAQITVKGSVEGEDVSWPVSVTLAEKEPANNVLAKVWARQKIEDLMQQSYYFGSPAVEEAVTALALDYRLMSQYTSFVAVDTSKKAELSEPAARPRQMLVPVPLPEGTQWEGFFGEDGEANHFGDFTESLKRDPARGVRFGGGFAAPDDKARDGQKDSVKKLMMPMRPALGPQPGNHPVAATPGKPGDFRNNRQQLGQGKGEGQGGGRWGMYKGRELAAVPGPMAPREEMRRALRGGDIREYSKAVNGLLKEQKEVDRLEGEQLATNLTLAALYDAKLHTEGVPAALAAAAEAEKKQDLATARRLYVRAYFLDMAAANLGYTGGDQAAHALAAIEALDEKLAAEWVKERPALAKKLNLVITNKSIPEALAEIAKASGVSIELVEGSLADVASLVPSRDVRITYLDLRRATVAQALDFALKPYRLEWWPVGAGKVAAGSSRRRDALTPWIYDVAQLAIPTTEELGKDQAKHAEIAQKATREFLAAIRAELKLEADGAVWFAPGQLLVFGPAKGHQAAGELFANLAKPNFQPAGNNLNKLLPVVVSRVKVRAELLALTQSAVRISAVMEAHENFAWQLLAGAASGQLDVEALTELSMAWHRPETAKLLEGPAAAVALRSWWAIAETARALPGEAELASLAEFAGVQSQKAVKAAYETLGKTADDPSALASVIYSALAEREKADVRAKALAAVAKSNENANLSIVVGALLDDPAKIDRAKLAKLLTEGVASGADLTVLSAMACRRAGGEAWNAFRAQSRDLIGGQPLPGSVVVLVNQLGTPVWPWLAGG